MIELKNICKTFGKHEVLKDFSLQIKKNEFVAIIGESGAGKTTILNIISMLEQPDAGEIVINENNHFTKKEIQNLRRYVFGYIFQNYVLIEEETVKENLLISKKYRKNFKEQELEEVMYKVGLPKEYLDHKVYELSGGEQQRVAIARSLATDVDLLFADEPNGNLNQEMSDEIVKIFEELAHKHNKCIIMVTHSKEIADKSDCILCLEKGLLKLDE